MLLLGFGQPHPAAADTHAPTPAKPWHLSPSELQDHRSVAADMQDNVPYKLNLADARDWRFFQDQLEAANFDPARRPQLQERIDQQRQAHIAGDFTPQVETLAQPTAEDPLVDQPHLNYIADLSTDGHSTYTSAAVSSVRGGTNSTHMTLSLHREDNGQQIGPAGTGGGTNPNEKVYEAETQGQSNDVEAYALYTYFYVDRNGTFHGPTSIKMTTSDALPTITNEAPTSSDGNPDTDIRLCVNRAPNSANHCDYGESPRVNRILFPVRGRVDYPNNLDLDGSGKPVNAYVTMNVVNYTQGGGCQAWGSNTSEFFADAGTLVHDKLISWTFQPEDFGKPADCMNNGDTLNYNFVLQAQSDGQPLVASVTSTPPRNSGPNTTQIGQLKLIMGCLAPGTSIELADGTTRKIEAFEAEGESVRTGHGAAMSVVGNTSGHEETMIRLVTEDGRELVLSALHPVVTERRGVLVAEALSTGERVVTRDGAAAIAELAEVDHDGPVHNIEVGAPGEGVSTANTTMFANGILVGDQSMQETFGREHLMAVEQVLEVLPEPWHQDHLRTRSTR